MEQVKQEGRTNVFFSHMPELIIVLVIALLFFGPRRLPELGASLGGGIREFRKATSEMKESFKDEKPAALAAATEAPATIVTGTVERQAVNAGHSVQ